MSLSKTRTLLTLGAVPCLALAGLVQGSGAVAAASAHAGPMHSMIVLLRNQNRGLAIRSSARRAAVRNEQKPIISQLKASGAKHISSIGLVNAVSGTMSKAEIATLRANPAVAKVIPNVTVRLPAAQQQAPIVTRSGGSRNAARRATASSICGTAASPEIDPEALTNINALSAQNMGYTGAGVKVAYIADGVDPTNPDFQRNPSYASTGSLAGTPVISQYDFSGDGPGAPTAGGEAFLDASSIAAQGNQTYDLSQYVNSSHPLPAGCDIKIIGAAPGASVMALDVFSSFHDTTEANFLQAISFAVANGANVINESFGSNNFPDTAQDATRLADDAAVAAGVTVVVSSGDAGVTSTQGSPATDPNLIDVGASTSFRSYEQVAYGGINDPNSNGQWVSNNISSISSGGFAQSNGRTVDLVAPGDLNWALCTPNPALYADCRSVETGQPASIQQTGGTSESSPLTAGAAADVIQAYASSHGGADPTPAQVKQILTSTATDIGAPATEQGAGLLNVGAAVQEASSLPGTSTTPNGGLLVSPGQINVTQDPNQTTGRDITLTNTSSSRLHVDLSTRALTHVAGDQSGSFCMQPGTPTASCPANTGVFPIWSGVNEVYQDVHFTVPSTNKLSRLMFTADYQYSGQSSLLHVGLIEPDGTYAGYSLPQGLADFARVEVANPPAGQWTAVFFTEQNVPHSTGTSGPVQWDASTMTYQSADRIEPESLDIRPGQSATAHLWVSSPHHAGDTSESVVLGTSQGTTTVPVTIRTLVNTHDGDGGHFRGILTGGNGRSAPAQTNTYQFRVPRGESDLDVGITLANDPQDVAIVSLVDPNGQTLGYSSNVTSDSNFNQALSTTVDVYHAQPQPGVWSVIVDWFNPVSGLELQEPFRGTVKFDRVRIDGTDALPDGHDRLAAGQTYNFPLTIRNTGVAPEAFFADPRLNSNTTLRLPDQNGSDTGISLPLPPGETFPYYFVPSHTSEVDGSLTGSVPVQFDMEPFPGDPDVGSTIGTTATATFDAPEVMPGFWYLNPSEVGPYGAPAPAATANASMSVVTQGFDPTVTSTTGDLWTVVNGMSSSFSPVYVASGGSGSLTVSITPTAAPGTRVSGVIYVDDFTLGGFENTSGDDLAAIPFSYTVARTD